MKCLAIIATILQAVVLVCVVVATPMDVFRSKEAIVGDYYACYSMWGAQRCGNHKANPNSAQYKGFPCKHVRTTMNTAAAFAIISIDLTLIVLLLCVCKCIGGSMIPAIVGIIAFCTILVSWAFILGAYYYGACKGKLHTPFPLPSLSFYNKKPRISKHYNLDVGFALMVGASALQLANAIIMFFA